MHTVNVPSPIKRLVEKHGIANVRDSMALMSGYKATMPSIDEFIESDSFLGKCEMNVYPYWRKVLRDIYPNPYNAPYRVVVFTMAIGTGKSTTALIMLMYDICRLLHLSDAQKYHGLSKAKPISFALVNRTLTLSASVLLDSAKNMIAMSPFFAEHASLCKSRKLLFDNIELVHASKAGHILGRDVIFALLSELAFFDSPKQAAEAYHNAETRIDSRFLPSKNKTGNWPGHIVVDSSPADSNSFVNEKFIKKARDSGDTYVVTGTYWDVHGTRTNPDGSSVLGYSGDTFTIFYGTEERDPAIITEENKASYEDESNLVKVPVEHRALFENDLIRNIADKAGISTVASGAFITSPSTIAKSMSMPLTTKQTYELDYDEDIPVILPPSISRTVPLFIHLDLSLTGDRTGIAISHTAQDVEIDVFGAAHFSICTPVAFAIQAKTQIPLAGIKKWIIKVSQEYTLHTVTADQYQSAMLLQELNQRDINAKICSVDITTVPYDAVKRLMIDERIEITDNLLLKDEFKKLMLIRHGKTKRWKVDHPEGESKDIADAVAGSVYTCLTEAGEGVIKQAQVDDRLNEIMGTKQIVVDEIEDALFSDDTWE